jgi:hypothetical protein
MAEGGAAAAEVEREISHHHGHGEDHHDWIVFVEAALLAVVAVLAAWSGYSAAKWNTESRLDLARASTARTEAANHQLAAMTQRNFDSSTFTAWFVAYVAGDPVKETVAEHRFTPNFRLAFDAWMATHPETNPDAPPGPTYMRQYRQPDARQAAALTIRADSLYTRGAASGSNSDRYVLITVYFSTVLFLIAISGHFRVRSVRLFLVGVGVVVLVFAAAQLATLPAPPG